MSPLDGTGQDAGAPCDGHPGTAAEFRQLAVAALDRLQPFLDRLRADAPADVGSAAAPTAADTPSTCAVCPVCAVLAALRGERPEMAVRLADQVTGLLAVLRAALDEGAGAPPSPPAPGTDPPGGTRRVQHIPVARG